MVNLATCIAFIFSPSFCFGHQINLCDRWHDLINLKMHFWNAFRLQFITCQITSVAIFHNSWATTSKMGSQIDKERILKSFVIWISLKNWNLDYKMKIIKFLQDLWMSLLQIPNGVFLQPRPKEVDPRNFNPISLSCLK